MSGAWSRKNISIEKVELSVQIIITIIIIIDVYSTN